MERWKVGEGCSGSVLFGERNESADAKEIEMKAFFQFLLGHRADSSAPQETLYYRTDPFTPYGAGEQAK